MPSLLQDWRGMPNDVKDYVKVTGNYWAFTLTDGALRMLVVLYFHQLGYNALSIASLFLFYEAFGVITNLFGGWLGAKIGLNKTMNIGLGLQIVALLMLTVPSEYLALWYVMVAQAMSGIAKDLNKLSAKSSIKYLVKSGDKGKLFGWIAVLTGSKNALKGVGFFIGGALLTLLGFQLAIGVMTGFLILVWLISLITLKSELGKTKTKPKFKELFSKSAIINRLSAARFALFGARDVWFVVALPVYFSSQFGWSHAAIGAFMASWVIGYGIVQSLAPKVISFQNMKSPAFLFGILLTFVTMLIALTHFWLASFDSSFSGYTDKILAVGIMLFGLVFAINSSLHSFLIVHYAKSEGVSLDVGFYYMSNAAGRLVGTVLSGSVYVSYGLTACLITSVAMLAIATGFSKGLPEGLAKS